MPRYDLIIIGAGIAGMTAAISAANEGVKNILIIEKEARVGGIINQFIHNGFGEKYLGEAVTGPEYVDFVERKLKQLGIEVILNTAVLEVSKDNVVTYVNPKDGMKDITASSIVLAIGARETYSGSVCISVNGLTGIFSLGEAHRIVNLEGYLPGKKTIIMAKDKWAFIVARRLLIEGGKIEGLVIEKAFDEVVDEDIHNIIYGFDIPIIENSIVMEIEGENRIEKIKLLNLENGTIFEKECDSLLLSVGFVPDMAIIKKLKLDVNNETLGPKVVDYKTSMDGIFACGNFIYGEKALKLKEFDGTECGIRAAEYLKQ